MTDSKNEPKHAQQDPDLMILDLHKAKFALGRLVATPGALHAVSNCEISAAVNRHLAGDWGEVGTQDRAENDHSLKHGYRLFSVYRTESGEKFWIITEADRSATTVLLPEEY